MSHAINYLLGCLKGSFRYADVDEIRDLQYLASVFVSLPFLF